MTEKELKAYDEMLAAMTRPCGYGNAEHYRTIRGKNGARYILENLPDLMRELQPLPEAPEPISSPIIVNEYINVSRDEYDQLKGRVNWLQHKVKELQVQKKKRGSRYS